MDLIDLNGPLYSGFDNRVAALRLVQKGLCDAALFDPSGAQLVSSKNTTSNCCFGVNVPCHMCAHQQTSCCDPLLCTL